MSKRLDYAAAAPEVRQIMLEFWRKVEDIGLDHKLLHLVYMRASQINGCAFCIDMHAKDMRAAGESEAKVYMLDAWRESPLYDAKERAALAWTEAVTILPNREVSDEVYALALTQFSEADLARLTLAIVEINCWNRLNIAFRAPPGNYKPKVSVKSG